ncbi:conserved hypothetical protein [Trichinella spiralis]|uniref:hypothetical protein n=1 Tax=Trichinella spiralis TaxID=6334 RepID=UPI0001EFC3DD|nr:conserved hypothetical protein [Trichinella spiralis]
MRPQTLKRPDSENVLVLGYPGLPGRASLTRQIDPPFVKSSGNSNHLLVCFYANSTSGSVLSLWGEVETARSTATIPTPFTSLITMGAKNGRLSNSDIKDLEKSTYCK